MSSTHFPVRRTYVHKTVSFCFCWEVLSEVSPVVFGRVTAVFLFFFWFSIFIAAVRTENKCPKSNFN